MKNLSLKFAGRLFRTAACAVCALALSGLTSCSDDDPTPPPAPSKGEEAVKEVIEVLENNPEVSRFVEALKTLNVSDLTEDELTVFAVKNSATYATTRQSAADVANVLDSVSVMRSIAKGSYALNELEHGMVLRSISDEELHVTMDANGFLYVNGTRIEGDGTPAGNSYVYLVPEVLRSYSEGEQSPDSVDLDEIRYLWGQSMTKYNNAARDLESQLITGFGGFSYNDVETVSDTFWNLAYNTLEEGYEYLQKVASTETNQNLADSIALDMTLMRVQLYGYYGQVVWRNYGVSADETKEQLIADLQSHIGNLPSALAGKARLALAKVYVWSQMYNEAQSVCGQMEEKPNEALLIEAIALKNTGREMEALDAVNAVRAELSLPTATGLDGDVLIETCHQCLVGEAQLYPYYRLLQKSINYMATVAGFDAKKHFYLPIPQEALETDDTLTQNPEY